MLDLEELLVNQLRKLIRDRNPEIDSHTIDRLKLAIDDHLVGYKKHLSSNPKYLVIDLEATTDGKGNVGVDQEIIEIGCVLVSEDGRFFSRGDYNQFVRPINNPILSDFCKDLTHITQDDVDFVKPFPGAILDLENWLWEEHHVFLKDLVVCAWGDDKDILKLECKNKNMEYIFGPSRNIALEYKAKFHKNHASLKSALDFFGMTFEGTPHRALSDANNAAKIFVEHILK